MVGALDGFDIVFHFTTIGLAQADDSPRISSIHKGDVVENPGLRYERNHAQFGIVETIINPDQRSFPIELGGQG